MRNLPAVEDEDQGEIKVGLKTDGPSCCCALLVMAYGMAIH